jgi:hypothetical protein
MDLADYNSSPSMVATEVNGVYSDTSRSRVAYELNSTGPGLANINTGGPGDAQGRTSLLGLPAELRQLIYELVVIKNRAIITMLGDQMYSQSGVSACQPALSMVCQQLRSEALRLFYRDNEFRAELTSTEDLQIAERWLHAIGVTNLRQLQHLTMGGWTKVPFGHMLVRRWVNIRLNLMTGALRIEQRTHDYETSTGDGSPQISNAILRLEDSFKELVVAANAVGGFDAAMLTSFMKSFHALCFAY